MNNLNKLLCLEKKLTRELEISIQISSNSDAYPDDFAGSIFDPFFKHGITDD